MENDTLWAFGYRKSQGKAEILRKGGLITYCTGIVGVSASYCYVTKHPKLRGLEQQSFGLVYVSVSCPVETGFGWQLCFRL